MKIESEALVEFLLEMFCHSLGYKNYKNGHNYYNKDHPANPVHAIGAIRLIFTVCAKIVNH